MQRRRRRGTGSLKEQSKQSRQKRHVLLAWSAVLVVTALGVLVFFFLSWLRPQIGKDPLLAEDAAGRPMQTRNVSKFESPTESAALDLVKQALAVRDPGEVGQYFRHQADEAAVVAFLAGMETSDGTVIGYQWLSSMDANGLLIDGVLVNTSKEGAPQNRMALLTPDDNGVWKIDFEAFARAVQPSWEELLAEGDHGGVVRVILGRDSYFNGPFKDDGKWQSYGMASPDHDTILVGYCRKGSPQERAMEWISSQDKNSAGQRFNRATLELKRPVGAESRQFEISRVLAEDWVLADQPFDAAF